MNNSRLKRFLVFLTIPFGIVGVIAFAWWYFGLTLNLTNSFPIGIYQINTKTKWNKGDLVVACPPNNNKFKINNHNYLGKGHCPSGTYPLLKKIGAVPGDLVEVKNLVYINGVQQKNSNVYMWNNFTKMHPCYGKRIIAPGTIWIMSDYNEKSFDSRYFCEVPAANVIGKAKLLLEF